jgi:hypothetical protein
MCGYLYEIGVFFKNRMVTTYTRLATLAKKYVWLPIRDYSIKALLVLVKESELEMVRTFFR